MQEKKRVSARFLFRFYSESFFFNRAVSKSNFFVTRRKYFALRREQTRRTRCLSDYPFKGGKNMNIKTNLKRIWSVTAVLSLGLLIYLWLGENESPRLVYTILALNALLFILALPCSIFGAATVLTAWYVLELNPVSAEGVYLNTIVLFLLGAVQWFWLIRFYYPPETPFQKLNLTEV